MENKKNTKKVVWITLFVLVAIITMFAISFFTNAFNTKNITLSVLNGRKIDVNAYSPRDVAETGSIWAEFIDDTNTLKLTGTGTLSKAKFYQIARDLYDAGKISGNKDWTCSFEDRISFPEDSSRLFSDTGDTFRTCDIILKKGVDTSKVTDMSYMFSYAKIANPDTSDWDTSKVTNMQGMFWNTLKANPDTSSWDTSKVTNMSGMFWGAEKATPDTRGWDTSKVTDMSHMFSGALKANPDTSRWDTSKVTNMVGMFNGCGYSGNVSNFNFSQLKYGERMLDSVVSTRIDLSNMKDYYEQIDFKEKFNFFRIINPKVVDEIKAPKGVWDKATFSFGNAHYAFFKEDGTTLVTPTSVFEGNETQSKRDMLSTLSPTDIVILKQYTPPVINVDQIELATDPTVSLNEAEVIKKISGAPEGSKIVVDKENIRKTGENTGVIPVKITLPNTQVITVEVPYTVALWENSVSTTPIYASLNQRLTENDIKKGINLGEVEKIVGHSLNVTEVKIPTLDTFGVKTAKAKVVDGDRFKEVDIKVVVSKADVQVKFEGGPSNATATIVAKKNGIVLERKEATKETPVLKFENLVTDKEKEIVNISFEVEKKFANYTVQQSENPYKFVFKYLPEKITLEITKQWEGGNKQIPGNIGVRILQNGKSFGYDNIIIAGSEGWIKSIVVDKMDNDGQDYAYTVAEKQYSSLFTPTVQQTKEENTIKFNIINKYNVPEISKEYKINFQDPATEQVLTGVNFTLRLLQNGVPIQTKQVSSDGVTTTVVFENLPKTDAQGNDYLYTVDTPDLPETLTKEILGNVIYIKLNPKPININIKTEFINGEENLPNSISVKLLRDGKEISEQYNNIQLFKGAQFKKVIQNMPIIKSYNDYYTYTLVVNNPVENFTSEVVKENNSNFILKNTYVVPKTSKKFKIAFENGPDNINVRLNLLGNNKPALDKVIVALGTKDNRKFDIDIDDLPKTEENGKEIVYTLAAEDLGPNYKIVSSGDTVTISYVVPKKVIDIQKQWVNGDNVRPNQIVGKLYRKVVGQDDSTKEFVQNITITKTDKKSDDQNIWQKSVEVDQTNLKAQEYEYSIVENPVPGFNTTYSGPLKIVNEYVPGNKKITVAVEFNGGTGKESVLATLNGNGSKTSLPVQRSSSTVFTVPANTLTGDKINYALSMEEIPNYEVSVQDNGNQDNLVYTVTYNYQVPKFDYTGKVEYIGGPRPNIQVVLVQNGKVLDDKIATLTKEQFVSSNKKDVIFDNIPKTNDQGEEYTYTIQLKEVPENYNVSYEDGVLKIKYITPVEKIPVHINWEKGLQKRVPVDVEIVKITNGKEEVVDVVNLNLENNYQGLSKDLPQTDDNGQKIDYVVRVKTVPKDFVIVENPDDKMGVTLKYVIPKDSFVATKIWENGPAQKPEIVLELLANSEPTGKEYRLTNGVVTCKFDGLNKTDINGTEIIYSVKEKTQLEDYSVQYVGNNKVKNTYVIQYITISKKIIVDGGKDLPPVTVQLLKNGEVVDTKKVNPEELSNIQFTNVPKTDKNGNEYKYTIVLKDVPQNYVVKQLPDGNISMEYTSPKIGVTVTKKWVGGDVKIPDSIDFELLRNDEVLGKYTVTKEQNWQLDIPNLLKTDKFGNDYTYTVKEVTKVEDFEKHEEGLEITNTYVIPQTKLNGQVIFDGGELKKNVPATVVVVVTSPDGKTYEKEFPTNGKNIVDYSFDVPKTDDKGNDIKYNVTCKISDENYKVVQDGNNVRVIYVSPKESKSFAFEYVNGQAQRKDVQVNVLRNGQVVGKTITIDKSKFDGNNVYVLQVDELDIYNNDMEKYTYDVQVANAQELANFVISKGEYTHNESTIPKVVFTYQIPNLILEGMINFDSKLGKRPAATLIILQDGKEFRTVKLEDGKYLEQVPRTDEQGNEYKYTVDLDIEKGTPYKVEWDEVKTSDDDPTIKKDFKIVYVSPKETLKIQTNFVGLRGLRPQTTINIYQNGKLFKTIKTDKEFTEVEVDKTDQEQKDYIYTISQEPLAGYETQVNGMVITNTLKPKDLGNGFIPFAGLTKNVPLMIFTMSVVTYVVYSGIRYINVKRKISKITKTDK